MTPALPIEFVVRGTAVSLQASTQSRETWKATVKAAAEGVIPPGSWALTDRIAVTIYYFPEGEMIGDIDNIVKPILDAMCRFVYIDDRQVDRVVVQKFEPDHIFAFGNPTAMLLNAITVDGSAVYIRVTDNPDEDLQ